MNHIIYVGKHLLTLTVSRHAHSSWELVYCTDGSGTFHFDDGDLPYKKGDVVILPPYVPHGNSSRDGFTNIHMNMTDTSLPFKSPAIVQDDSNQFLLQAFQAIYFHFNGDPHRRRLLMSPYGDLIYCYLMSYHKTQPLSPVVEEIENNIIQNYPDCNYELDKYLQSFPFSYDYLRKLFKKELGVTPHKYLTDKPLPTPWPMALPMDATLRRFPSNAASGSPCISPGCSKRNSGWPPATIWKVSFTAPTRAPTRPA